MGTASFNRCDFLLGQGYNIVIVIPAMLPKADTYTVSVTGDRIRFRAGHQDIADLPYQGGEVFERILHNTQIGLVEHPPGTKLPNYITNTAYVEVRRGG